MKSAKFKEEKKKKKVGRKHPGHMTKEKAGREARRGGWQELRKNKNRRGYKEIIVYIEHKRKRSMFSTT